LSSARGIALGKMIKDKHPGRSAAVVQCANIVSTGTNRNWCQSKKKNELNILNDEHNP
jgi:hypothetical protein